ncbi:MAG: hypothetical protein FJ291_14405 [Planctomycetes bacterium]|nr:hypothetical protein [Planctomycetota bacterium]
MIGCEGVRELAQACLEGEASAAERERLEHHLHACPACRQMVATYRRLFAALAEPAIPPVRPRLAAGVLARVEAAQRRRSVWQAVALAAALFVVGAAAALLTWGGIPQELSAAADSAPSLDAWTAAWGSVVGLAEAAAAESSEWLRVVPGGAAMLALLVAALAAQGFLVYRWRAPASLDGGDQARVTQ